MKQRWIYLAAIIVVIGSFALNEFVQWNKYKIISNNQEIISELAGEIALAEIEDFKKKYNITQPPDENRPYLIIVYNGTFYNVFNDANNKLLFNHTQASTAIEWAWANLSEGGRFYTYGPGQTWILNENINSQNEAITWVSDRSLLFQAGPNLDTSPIQVTHNYTGLYGIKLDVNKKAQSPGADMSGIYFIRASHGIIKDCEVYNAKRTTRTRGEGIELGRDSDYNIIEGNYCWENDYDGIKVKGGNYNTITGNTLFSNGASGIQIAIGVGNTVVGNTINGDRKQGPTAGWTRGIVLHGASMNTISSNTIHGVSRGLMIVEDCVGNILSNNIVENSEYGFWAYLTQNPVNVIDNNIFFDLEVYGIRIESAALVDSRITNNYINDAPIGISIAHPSASNNIVQGNTFRSVVKPVEDLGKDTQYEIITVPFVEGTEYLHTDKGVQGWLISAPGDYATTSLTLPKNVEKIVSIQVWAIAQIDTGNMALELNLQGGRASEPYNSETITITGHPTENQDHSSNDVIFWEFDETDDSDIGDLRGGEAIQLIVIFESDEWASTNAVFTCILIEYV